MPYDIFADAWVDTTVFVVSKREKVLSWPRKQKCNVNLRTFPKKQKIGSISEFNEQIQSVNFADWFKDGGTEYLTYADASVTKLMRKIQQLGVPLGELADIQRGVTPFVLSDSPVAVANRVAFNGSIKRYAVEDAGKKYIRYDATLAEYKPERYFKGRRLLLRELISRQFRLQATKVSRDFITNKSMQSILAVEGGLDVAYLLGFLNSKLLSWYFLSRSNIAQRDDFPKIVLKESRSLPIINLNLDDPKQKSTHDQIVTWVEQLLKNYEKLGETLMDADRNYLRGRCDELEQQIDKRVFELFQLSSDEVKIVQASP